ncbi:MAG: hypothetical protein R3C05_17230 [Pirellulaceae bacterium]
MNDTIRDLVMANASTDEIRDVASANGMVTLRDFGMGLVYKGVTSLEEVVRETVDH